MILRPVTNRIAILLLAVLFFVSVGSRAQVDTLGFVNRIVKSISNKDRADFLAMLPTYQDLSDLREIALAHDSTFIPPPVDSIYQEMMERMTENFEKLIERGEERGFQWRPVEAGDLQIRVRNSESDPVELVNIRLELGPTERKSAMRIQAAFFHGRWVLSDTIKLSY
jgi:hypothetical protein